MKRTENEIRDMSRADLGRELGTMGEYNADWATRDIDDLREHLMIATGHTILAD